MGSPALPWIINIALKGVLVAPRLVNYLESLPPIDWSAPTILETTAPILEELSASPSDLGELVDWSSLEPGLRRQYECHAQFDRFVLYDDLEGTGIRVRMHVWHDNTFDLPHQHRYAFTSKILTGGYEHVLYSIDEELLEASIGSSDARPYQDPLQSEHSPDVALSTAGVSPQFRTRHQEGDIYFLGPDMVHSSSYTGGAVSLFVRGPAVRENAFEMELDSGKAFRRHGQASESVAQREDVIMTEEAYVEHRAYLVRLGLL